ncbi:MAG: isochorismatase family protein [Gammaproteobacteria bacterium]|nr:isochorismatase family protein [Gammaproteobacteria bacterium]MDH5651845.1 isochorismatase family protein [Gammaproteobacteria bacterium]
MTAGTSLLCESIRSQLIVIDIQQRLATAMPDKALQNVTRNTGLLLQAAGLLEVPVIRTEQYPKGLGDTLPEVAGHLPAATVTLEKTCFSCMGATGFNKAVNPEGRNQIILAGMESHVCVLQTAMQLQAQGNLVFIAADAVCSRHKQNHKNALKRMAQAGIVISNTESILFEWLRDANHVHFKTISALLR